MILEERRYLDDLNHRFFFAARFLRSAAPAANLLWSRHPHRPTPPRRAVRSPLTALALCAPLLIPSDGWAQTTARAPRAADRLWGVWAGASFSSPTDTYWGGTTPGRSLFLVGLRAQWVVETLGPVAIAFTADLIPAAVVDNNPRWQWRVREEEGRRWEYKAVTDSGFVYGAGLSPLGLHLSAPVSGAVRVFAGGSVGGIWFTHEVPLPYARSFNYALEFGGGLDVATGPSHVIVIGLKVHHLSNMNAAVSNPGLDGHVFYLGLLRRRVPLR